MEIREVLICGYYDEANGKDYIVEVNKEKLKQWFLQEGLDLLDYEDDIKKKIIVYGVLETELTKGLDKYSNFTVKFI